MNICLRQLQTSRCDVNDDMNCDVDDDVTKNTTLSTEMTSQCDRVRTKIIREMIGSERDYVKHLHDVIEVIDYLKTISSPIGQFVWLQMRLRLAQTFIILRLIKIPLTLPNRDLFLSRKLAHMSVILILLVESFY